MGSTNKTAHYELPQFVANDKPSWLGDVNEAMEAIDTGIYGAKASADGAQQTANNAVAGVQSAGTRMDGIQTQLDTVATQANQTATTVTGHTSAIATNSANINTLNSRIGSTDISAIGDGTVTGAIDAIAESGGGGGQTVVAEVTADGVKTLATLLSELYSLLTGHNLSYNAKCLIKIDDVYAVFSLAQKSDTAYTFTKVESSGTDLKVQTYVLSGTSHAYTSARANTTNDSTSVRPSGNKIIIVD